MFFSESRANIPRLTCSLVFVSGPRRTHGAQTAVVSAASQRAATLSARRLTRRLSTQDTAEGEKWWLEWEGKGRGGKENNTKVCWRREQGGECRGGGGGGGGEWDNREEGRGCVCVCHKESSSYSQKHTHTHTCAFKKSETC